VENDPRVDTYNKRRNASKLVHAVEDAQAKAKIIQALIRHGIVEASEVYMKTKDYLGELSKKEISMYAHRTYDKEVVQSCLPDLPPPMSVREFDSMKMKSVEALENEMTEACLLLD
jgi:hypothetical protein